MTPEEAAEVILGGVFWCGCEDCNATGLVTAKKEAFPDFPHLEGLMKTPCVRCYGTGSMARPPYEEACQLLGKPLPKYEPEGLTVKRMESSIFKLDKMTAFQPYEYPISSLIQTKKDPNDP